MENMTIHVRWEEGDPIVGVKLNGYEGKGTKELKEVILVIKDSLISSFPDVVVKIIKFEEGE